MTTTASATETMAIMLRQCPALYSYPALRLFKSSIAFVFLDAIAAEKAGMRTNTWSLAGKTIVTQRKTLSGYIVPAIVCVQMLYVNTFAPPLGRSVSLHHPLTSHPIRYTAEQCYRSPTSLSTPHFPLQDEVLHSHLDRPDWLCRSF